MGILYRTIILTSLAFLLGMLRADGQCPDLEEVVHTQIYDCDDMAFVCIPVKLEDILSDKFTISVDDQPYDNGYMGCDFDSTIVYSYFTLLGQGEAGPYLLESWSINDQEFSGEFQDLDELLIMMNTWDPQGDWNLTPETQSIFGGNLSQTYSDIVIEQLQLPGTYATLGLNYGQFALGTVLAFPEGVNILELTDGEQCNEIMEVYVACTPTEYLEETVYAGLSGELCLDDSQLLGENPTVQICSSTNDEVIEFLINPTNQCITYIAHTPGVETGCFVICDDLGICDSTYLTVTSLVPPEGEIIINTIVVGQTLTECLSAEDLQGNDFTISNDCPSLSNGNIDFGFESGSLCVQYTGMSVGVDTACILICDNTGMCDSTMFYISAIAPSVELPVALDDTISMMQNETGSIPVLDNDTIDYLATLTVLTEPTNGGAYVMMDNQIAYEPDEDFCGTDVFSYMLCNLAGCDTATVEINITCEDLRVYNGFSPNGDGVNDRFRIGGIESYPNCSVKVYNVWGNLVYENVQGEGYKYNSGWDGTWNGKELIDGNYFYMIELNDEAKQSFSGYVLLHR